MIAYQGTGDELVQQLKEGRESHRRADVAFWHMHAKTVGDQDLKMVPQAATNDYFSANLYLDSGNFDGQLKDLGGYVSPKSIGFVVNGQFYRVTLKHK